MILANALIVNQWKAILIEDNVLSSGNGNSRQKNEMNKIDLIQDFVYDATLTLLKIKFKKETMVVYHLQLVVLSIIFRTNLFKTIIRLLYRIKSI